MYRTSEFLLCADTNYPSHRCSSLALPLRQTTFLWSLVLSRYDIRTQRRRRTWFWFSNWRDGNTIVVDDFDQRLPSLIGSFCWQDSAIYFCAGGLRQSIFGVSAFEHRRDASRAQCRVVSSLIARVSPPHSHPKHSPRWLSSPPQFHPIHNLRHARNTFS